MTDASSTAGVAAEPYGTLSTGEQVERYRLRTDGLQLDVVTFGARIISLLAPDRAGQLGEVTLGLADVSAYEDDRNYFGASIGRYANRIAGGRFELDGQTYEIPSNENGNALHGGAHGFDRMVWDAEPGDGAEVRLSRVSADGEMGFPGRLDVSVRYRLEGSDLAVEYAATTSAPTVFNPTNHTYFNLAGRGSVEDHVVCVDSEKFLSVDTRLIPTGELTPVEGTPLDLRSPTRIGTGLRANHPQLHRARGYDHTFVLGAGGTERRAARVEHEGSLRSLELWTDRPGVQLYSANFLDGTVVGRDGTSYRQGDAFCLEPQHFPDSPHHPTFPTTELRPGEIFHARDVYRFATR